MPTPEVNPDGSITPSVLLVTGDKDSVTDSLNDMYVLGLRHALQAIEANPFTAVEFIEKLIKKNTVC